MLGKKSFKPLSLVLLAIFFVICTPPSASASSHLIWATSTAPSTGWGAIATSPDGTKVIASPYGGGQNYISLNSGATWATSSAPWSPYIAFSSDGTKIASCNNGYIYLSTNSGATWATSSASMGCGTIVSSNDGTKLATIANTQIYLSTNSGATWATSSAPSQNWDSLTSSYDGTKLAAEVYDGPVYVSTNSGATWMFSTSSPAASVYLTRTSIASSFDGGRLYADAGNTYVSTDFGTTWATSTAPSNFGFGITSSSDGTKLAIIAFNGPVFVSTDSGNTWATSSAPVEPYQGLAASSDGSRIFAASGFTGIYSGQYYYPPTLLSVSTSTTASTATVSWTTNESATSTLSWGLTSSYGIATSTNASSTSPSFTLSGLDPCTLYHYQIASDDTYGDISTSTDATFQTGGCAANATVLATVAGVKTTASGGALALGNVTLTIPPGYTSTTTSSDFEIDSLATSTVIGSYSVPTASSTLVGSLYEMQSHPSATTTLPTFSTPLTVTFSFASGLSGVATSTLGLYQNTGTGGWVPLSSCFINALNSTVSCNTSNLSSVFALFGEQSYIVNPPVLSQIAAGSVSTSGATITWTTDLPSDSLVEYGQTLPYTSSSTYSASLVTSHSVSLSGLSSGTTYHYRVVSVSSYGNKATSTDQTFTTGSPASGGSGGGFSAGGGGGGGISGGSQSILAISGTGTSTLTKAQLEAQIRQALIALIRQLLGLLEAQLQQLLSSQTTT